MTRAVAIRRTVPADVPQACVPGARHSTESDPDTAGRTSKGREGAGHRGTLRRHPGRHCTEPPSPAAGEAELTGPEGGPPRWLRLRPARGGRRGSGGPAAAPSRMARMDGRGTQRPGAVAGPARRRSARSSQGSPCQPWGPATPPQESPTTSEGSGDVRPPEVPRRAATAVPPPRPIAGTQVSKRTPRDGAGHRGRPPGESANDRDGTEVSLGESLASGVQHGADRESARRWVTLPHAVTWPRRKPGQTAGRRGHQWQISEACYCIIAEWNMCVLTRNWEQ